MARKRKPDSEIKEGSRTWFRRRAELGLTEHPPVIPDVSIFNGWSHNLAWLLGIIWSDGCLYGNTIEVSSKDLQLIDLILSLVPNSTYGLKNNGQHVRVHFTSPIAARWLRDLGLTEAKSLTAIYPNIPQRFEPDFIRGVFDGDGYLGLREDRVGQQAPDLKFDITTASPAFRDGIADWMKRNEVEYKIRSDTPKQEHWHEKWRVMVNQQESQRKVYRLFYPHFGICCLHRKFSMFHQWYTTPRARSGRPT